MPGDNRLISLGVVNLGFTSVFGVLSFLSLGFPINLHLEFLMDPCSLYSSLIHSELNLKINQVSALSLPKLFSLYKDLGLNLDIGIDICLDLTLN